MIATRQKCLELKLEEILSNSGFSSDTYSLVYDPRSESSCGCCNIEPCRYLIMHDSKINEMEICDLNKWFLDNVKSKIDKRLFDDCNFRIMYLKEALEKEFVFDL